FNLNLTADDLRGYAAKLGSDCPFFIRSRPVMASGRGEVFSDVNLSLKGKFIVIVKPEVSVDTAEAFAAIVPQPPSTDLRTVLENHPVSEWKEGVKNDFEPVMFQRFPVIRALHSKLYSFGASFASMSGSGSAVFGIFEEEVDL